MSCFCVTYHLTCIHVPFPAYSHNAKRKEEGRKEEEECSKNGEILFEEIWLQNERCGEQLAVVSNDSESTLLMLQISDGILTSSIMFSF